jgi:predicted ABC-type sugar transport system permease subunit
MINQDFVYSIIGSTLLYAIPAFLIFALAFHLIFIKMILKPTVNLFRKIQRKQLI